MHVTLEVLKPHLSENTQKNANNKQYLLINTN